MDRLQAVRMGRCLGVDLADCDAPLPRSYADGVRFGVIPDSSGPHFPCFRFLAELTSMSILLGRTCESWEISR